MLKTKLNRPPINKGHVFRSYLVERLENNIHRPLTLVSAPAGYGKSMLISSWIESTNYSCAWISLNEDDNSLLDFLNYVYTSIEGIFPGSLKQLGSFLNANKLPPGIELTHTFINELDQIDIDFVLVLDDYHLIIDEGVHALINELLHYPPQHLHVVIITRRDPPLRISSLRAHSRLTEVRMHDLAFKEVEIISLFKRMKGTNLTGETALALSKSTEGWIMGLILIFFAYNESEAILLEPGSKKEHWAFDFLYEEVYTKLSDQTQELMMMSSFFDEFCIELMEAILPDNESIQTEELWDWLIQSNVFLIPLDHENKWFRYQNFFHDLLQRQAKKHLGIEEVNTCHNLASTWFDNNGYIENAIKHSIKGEDIPKAVDIFWRVRNTELEQDHWHTLEQWLKKIPEEVQEHNPSLLLTRAWIYYQQSRIDKIADAMDRLESSMEEIEMSDELMGEISFFKGALSYFAGEGQKSRVHLETAVEKLKVRTGLILGEAHFMHALALQMCGEKDAAIQMLNKCLATPRSSDIMYQTRIRGGLNFVYILAGDLINAEISSEQMTENMARSQSEYAMSWSDYLNAYVHFNSFLIEKALSEFKSAIERRFISDMAVSVGAFTGAVLSLQNMHRPEEARNTLNHLLEFVNGMNDPEFMPVALSCKAHLDLLQGDMTAAMGWLQTSQDIIDPLAIFLWIEVPIITKTRILIGSGTSENLTQAVDILLNVYKMIKFVNFDCQEIDILVLLSAAYHKQERTGEALDTLTRAVLLAEPQKWIRPFVEAGKPFSDLLESLKNDQVSPDFISEILQNIEQLENLFKHSAVEEINTQQASINLGLDALTIREVETLKWLSSGLRNKEIADKMFVSLDAVKKNLYRIFQKLNVKNRIELLNKAQDLGIFDDLKTPLGD